LPRGVGSMSHVSHVNWKGSTMVVMSSVERQCGGGQQGRHSATIIQNNQHTPARLCAARGTHRNAQKPILAPAVRAGAGMLVGEVFPCSTVRTVVLSHRAPLPLAKVRPPPLPVCPPRLVLCQAACFRPIVVPHPGSALPTFLGCRVRRHPMIFWHPPRPVEDFLCSWVARRRLVGSIPCGRLFCGTSRHVPVPCSITCLSTSTQHGSVCAFMHSCDCKCVGVWTECGAFGLSRQICYEFMLLMCYQPVFKPASELIALSTSSLSPSSR